MKMAPRPVLLCGQLRQAADDKCYCNDVTNVQRTGAEKITARVQLRIIITKNLTQ